MIKDQKVLLLVISLRVGTGMVVSVRTPWGFRVDYPYPLIKYKALEKG